MNDRQLLRDYVETGSETAFARLVETHVHSVYATARRVLQNDALAEEVAQDAFCLLARKARFLPQCTIIGAWLHRTTWHLAMKTLRSEARRQARERFSSDPPMNASSDRESLWSQIEPMLDEAIESLNPADRQAVLLRFFERKPARALSLAMGVSEEAARMRLSRAVEKLRLFFARRGVTCGSATLLAVLLHHEVEAAPASAVHKIQAAASAVVRAPFSVPVSAQLLLFMTQLKLKTTLIAGSLLLLAGLAGHHWLQTGTGSSGTQPETAINSERADNRSRRPSSGLARIFSRLHDTASPAEVAALQRLHELLYSTEPDDGMPPSGMCQAIQACGSSRWAALDMLLQAFSSIDPNAQHRAAASFQFFRESAGELVPKLLAVFKNSQDASLIQYAAMSASVLDPSPEMIPTLVEAFRENPAAKDGLESWIGSYLHDPRRQNDPGVVVRNLTPLLDSDKPDERWLAAILLAGTDAKNDPRVTASLVPALQSFADGNVGQAGDALRALKSVGASARSAADAIRQYGDNVPQSRELALDALAAVAPDLRSEIPDLDRKLQAREAAANLEQRANQNQASIAELVDALRNPEARMQAAERIGELGNQAASALPELRKILQAGDSDSRPDANNFLFSVASAIRQLDPAAPAFYRPEDLRPAFMDAVQELQLRQDQSAVRDDAERRMFSSRPFDGSEILAWIDKFKASDVPACEAFVKRLARAPALSQIQTDDSALARALTQSDGRVR